MARQAAVSVENSFQKGLITEATGLNFPENASTETYDCIFDEKGRILRRLGFDYEDDSELVTVASDISGNAIGEFLWENVAGQGDLTFVVIQVGDTLRVYEAGESSLSSNEKFTIDLGQFSTSGAPGPESVKCQFTSGNGALFVVHPYLEPFYVTYDPDADTHDEVTITIKIRDFKGVDDTLNVEFHPTTLSTLHKYNLYNQGWYVTASILAIGAMNVIDGWRVYRSTDYPSNADIWWLSKGADENMDSRNAYKTALGNTPAPKGHYILDAFYQDRTSVSGIAGLSVTSSGYLRPTTACFHSSRILYAGVNSQEYLNKIYFSQIIESALQYGLCHQANDPTSENLSDLLPTDGGVISILDAGSIIKLLSIQNSILVFATNGVWTISGNQGVALAANDYSIQKISSIGAISADSFVIVEGLPIWWNNDGIFTMQPDKQTGALTVKSLTDQTIKTFYDGIPSTSKNYAKGVWNTKTRVVQWLYRSTSATNIEESFQYDRILNLNTISGAFYPWTISESSATNGPFISGIIAVKGFGIERQTENVFNDAGDHVTDSVLVNVTIGTTTTSYLTSSFRYVTIVSNDSGATYDLTFSQEKDDDYVDWATFDDGIDYTSYALGGYKVHGKGSFDFQPNYVTIFMDVEENASCFLQGWFDFPSSVNSGRVSNFQQAYNGQANFLTSKRRLKIRGSGKVLQFKLFSETGKPFTVIGWSTFETSNTGP